MEEETYECIKCGKRIKTSKGKSPKCCNISMKTIPLDICIQPAHAEHARPMDEENACDDFRGG
jgi:hypothetical protein